MASCHSDAPASPGSRCPARRAASPSRSASGRSGRTSTCTSAALRLKDLLGPLPVRHLPDENPQRLPATGHAVAAAAGLHLPARRGRHAAHIDPALHPPAAPRLLRAGRDRERQRRDRHAHDRPADVRLWVVDGQHRLHGLERALKKDKAKWLADYPLPVVIVEGIDAYEEMRYFHVINTRHKGVPTDVVDRHLLSMREAEGVGADRARGREELPARPRHEARRPAEQRRGQPLVRARSACRARRCGRST